MTFRGLARYWGRIFTPSWTVGCSATWNCIQALPFWDDKGWSVQNPDTSTSFWEFYLWYLHFDPEKLPQILRIFKGKTIERSMSFFFVVSKGLKGGVRSNSYSIFLSKKIEIWSTLNWPFSELRWPILIILKLRIHSMSKFSPVFFCGVHSATATLLLRDPEAPRIGYSLYQNITILSFYEQYTSIKVDQKMYFHGK